MNQIMLPTSVKNQLEVLQELCETEGKTGRLKLEHVAAVLGCDKEWLRTVTYNNNCPFGFGSNKNVGRGYCCYPVLPFYMFMTQGFGFAKGGD